MGVVDLKLKKTVLMNRDAALVKDWTAAKYAIETNVANLFEA